MVCSVFAQNDLSTAVGIYGVVYGKHDYSGTRRLSGL